MTTKTSQVLALINKSDHHLSTAEIARHLGWASNTATRVVLGLRTHGFLERADVPVLATYKRTSKDMPTPMHRDRKSDKTRPKTKAKAAPRAPLPENPFKWQANA